MSFSSKGQITEQETLFTYPEGQGVDDYKNTNFTPIFEFPEVDAETEEYLDSICGDSFGCRYDLLLTGKEAVAMATQNTIVANEEIKEQAKTGK